MVRINQVTYPFANLRSRIESRVETERESRRNIGTMR